MLLGAVLALLTVLATGARAEVWGYYFDRYERTSQGWRITERVLRICGEDGFPAPWIPIERGSAFGTD